MISFFSYLIGSIPTGLLIGKIFKNKDLRYLGSHNIGSSNAFRILGLKYGIITFILDFLKGFILVFLFSNFSILNEYKDYKIFFGLSSILGHMFSIFNRFRGGKAIATSVGVISGINPIIGFLGILFFVIVLMLFGYASLSSLIATILVDLILWISWIKKIETIELCELIIIFFSTILIFWKHRLNIIYLLKGKENKFHFCLFS
nr:glycerol-3-phosphate 1-O-acyltransferase PlsY [Candidatus Phytoplasma pini]